MLGHLFRGQLGFSISFLEEMWRAISQPDDEPAEADRVPDLADDHDLIRLRSATFR